MSKFVSLKCNEVSKQSIFIRNHFHKKKLSLLAMTDPDRRAFVGDMVHFLREEIERLKTESDLVESLEVAIQCLEAVYQPTHSDVNVWQLWRTAHDVITPVEDAEALKNEGNRLMKEEKYQEALSNYNRAICIDVRNPIFYCNRAAAWIRLGDFDRAVVDAQMSLRYNPTYCKAHARLGDALVKMNRLEAAVSAFEEAVRLEPANVDYKSKLDITRQRLQESTEGTSGVNQGLAEMAARMMSDPSVNEVLSYLNDANSIESLLNTGRQLAMQMGAQNPQLFTDIRRLLQSNPHVTNLVTSLQQQSNNSSSPNEEESKEK
ncbi:small glutamine-rich tetratricopeptide repeat-containing protein beta-like [Phlebotomus argentipes]|uniref:small glutamine-rich tetratricopeptide repeat-containing protein beta-like n=1 Tax=Phlebotomus argentipes TaxID=94469 RepID=UPI00289341B2|nr:small glutamine-rich tetratricopeptide repeat-containing protein beta-like [Phlebotomus argentipes]